MKKQIVQGGHAIYANKFWRKTEFLLQATEDTYLKTLILTGRLPIFEPETIPTQLWEALKTDVVEYLCDTAAADCMWDDVAAHVEAVSIGEADSLDLND